MITTGMKYQSMKLPEFNFNSKDHLSLILFGGTLSIETIEPILNSDGTFYFYRTGKNKDQVKVKKVSHLVKITGMGLNPLPEWKTKKEGIYQTNEKALESILKLYECVKNTN